MARPQEEILPATIRKAPAWCACKYVCTCMYDMVCSTFVSLQVDPHNLARTKSLARGPCFVSDGNDECSTPPNQSNAGVDARGKVGSSGDKQLKDDGGTYRGLVNAVHFRDVLAPQIGLTLML